jgi:hypothetical protein
MAQQGRGTGRTNQQVITDVLTRLGRNTSNTTDRSVVLSCLNQAVDDFNLERTWQERRVSTTVDLVSHQATYTLTVTNFVKTVGRVWAQDTSGDRDKTIPVYPYEKFLRFVSDEGVTSSTPRVFSVPNRMDGTTGQVFVWPKPSADYISSNPTIEIHYYAEIDAYSDTSASTQTVSSAIERAIELKALTIANDMIGDEDKAIRFQNLADRAMGRAIAFDNRTERVNLSNLRGRF